MSLKIPLLPDENLLFEYSLSQKDNIYPVTFAVSDKAVFVTKEKHFALESWIVERIPIKDIYSITLLPESRIKIYVISSIISLFGLILIIAMIIPQLRNDPAATSSLIPYVIFAFGFFIPTFSKNRKVLIINHKKGKYQWKPKLITDANLHKSFAKNVIDSSRFTRITSLETAFLEACSLVGIPVLQ